MAHRLAVAGLPVGHSLSPTMHRAAFRATGVEGTYELAECDSDGFRRLVAAMGGPGGYTGLNVTMPHKGLAYELSGRLTPEAEAACSVNTMGIDDGMVIGHSSDVVGFARIFEEIGSARGVVVLGSGGSARAAIAAAPGQVGVLARNESAVGELEAVFGARLMRVTTVTPGQVLVNATPLGMRGESLGDEIVDGAAALIDLPYAAGATPAVIRARSRGIPVVDGLEFLARQAAVSFAWWTGVAVEASTMLEAVRNA